MAATVLDRTTAQRLAGQPFTYAAVGATRTRPPEGYRSFTASRVLPRGIDFDDAGHALLGWQVQRRAGLRVAASAPTAEPGAVMLMRLGIGAVALRIPCRVVYVVDEDDRRGFAYGTLPGHPEAGEEAFVLHREPDDRIRFVITAFSRPATAPARIGGPLTTAAQRLMTRRYLRTLDRPSA